MSRFPPTSLLLASLCFQQLVFARPSIHSLPDDIYAFPKFRVSFLNGQPVLHETAERWLKDGLRGGEAEFLNKPWDEWQSAPIVPLKGIDEEESQQLQSAHSPDDVPSPSQNHSLEMIKMGPNDSYLCFIPEPSPESSPLARNDQTEEVRTPAQSLAMLNSLSGKCLYHRHGWFTYAYCHGKEIRQFKERQTHPLSGRLISLKPDDTLTFPKGSFKIEEDPQWHAYTLGAAPTEAAEPGVDLALAESYASAGSLDVASSSSVRYLVQRWGNGTLCDKTGKPREAEVQFHCSTSVPDSILYVKETKTCSYVIVIQTPRLCNEPGFRSRHDTGEEAVIRCREVLQEAPPSDQAVPHLPQGDTPVKLARPKAVLPSPPHSKKNQKDADKKSSQGLETFAKAIESMLRDNGALVGDVVIESLEDMDNIVFDIVQDEGEGYAGAPDDDVLAENAARDDRITEALRQAGFVVAGKKNAFTRQKSQAGGEESEGDDGEDEDDFDSLARDEL